VTPLSSGPELLNAAVRYALAGAAMTTPLLLARPSPCTGWDLAMLLDHLCDSVAVLGEAIAAGAADQVPPDAGPERDPVTRLRGQAAGLLAAHAAAGQAGQAGRLVAIGDRQLTTSMVATTGALEITIHGWDIFAACGASRPVPPALASALLPAAVLLVTPGTRPGLFADPVRLPGPACPGDQLVAFLGRRPWRKIRDPNS
jgi:uncharacterized protein (TIGR03086 family)